MVIWWSVFVQQRTAETAHPSYSTTDTYTEILTWVCVHIYSYCGQHTCGYVWHVQAVMHQVVLMPVQQQRLGLVQRGREDRGWWGLSSNPSHFQRQPCEPLRVWNGRPAPELSSLQISDSHRQSLHTEKVHRSVFETHSYSIRCKIVALQQKKTNNDCGLQTDWKMYLLSHKHVTFIFLQLRHQLNLVTTTTEGHQTEKVRSTCS